MSLLKKVSEYIFNNFGTLFLIYFMLCAVVFSLSVYISTIDNLIFFTITFALFSIFILELFTILLLFCAYGKNFKYSYQLYFLKKHPVYGYCFRKNTKSKLIAFNIFDKFIFRSGSSRILNLNQNIASRLQFNINAIGLRGQELEQKNKFRIFCSGGSTTAGSSVNDFETWPSYLQLLFNDSKYDVEVINGGVQGWYSYQELLRYKHEILDLSPDVTLLHQGWNEEFLFSSLQLGKNWTPKLTRNQIQTYNFYTNKYFLNYIPDFPALHFILKTYYKKFVFDKKMNFKDPKRWRVLLQYNYILAWIDNIISFAKAANNNNILLYTINYPSLSTTTDSADSRNLYIKDSRLTHYHAEYQAISKARISKTLEDIVAIVPCLNVECKFGDITGNDRLKLFLDEMHMSPSGYKKLAKCIFEKLIDDNQFIEKYHNRDRTSNVNVNSITINNAIKNARLNSPHLSRLIHANINNLRRLNKSPEVQDEMYTTF